MVVLKSPIIHYEKVNKSFNFFESVEINQLHFSFKSVSVLKSKDL